MQEIKIIIIPVPSQFSISQNGKYLLYFRPLHSGLWKPQSKDYIPLLIESKSVSSHEMPTRNLNAIRIVQSNHHRTESIDECFSVKLVISNQIPCFVNTDCG